MTKIISKGTVLQQTVDETFVPIAQIISIGLDGMESETFESDTLDNTDAGIPYQATGRTEPGSLSGDLFFDPALQGHANLTYLLTNPGDEAWKLIFADTGLTEWPFTGAGFSLGMAFALNDGVKSDFSIKLDGLPTFPIAGSA